MKYIKYIHFMQPWSFRGNTCISSNLLTVGRIQQNINTATNNLKKLYAPVRAESERWGALKLGSTPQNTRTSFNTDFQEIFASIIPSSSGQLSQFYLSPQVGMLGQQ